MEYSQKVVMVPFDQAGGQIDVQPSTPVAVAQRKGNSIKDHALERQKRMLSIVLKLAEVKGYNSQLEIKQRNGSYLPQSDLVALLLHAVSPGRNVVGQKEFIDLLAEAQVDPSLITNLNIKTLLQENRPRSQLPSQQPTQHIPVSAEPMDVSVNLKRQRMPDNQLEDLGPKRPREEILAPRPILTPTRFLNPVTSTFRMAPQVGNGLNEWDSYDSDE